MKKDTKTSLGKMSETSQRWLTLGAAMIPLATMAQSEDSQSSTLSPAYVGAKTTFSSNATPYYGGIVGLNTSGVQGSLEAGVNEEGKMMFGLDMYEDLFVIGPDSYVSGELKITYHPQEGNDLRGHVGIRIEVPILKSAPIGMFSVIGGASAGLQSRTAKGDLQSIRPEYQAGVGIIYTPNFSKK